ncbi:MAG: type I glutamate--ammonia ligase [Eubacteriales bacterium]|nr:type I glutamate--ammonia ligase [Eubacteriales bacterium]
MKTKAEILRLVEEEDVEFIRLQFTDMFGTLKNIAVTANQLERAMENKYVFDGSSMYGNLRKGEEDMYLYPDLDTFVMLPWRPQQGKVARLLCDVCRADGTPLNVNSRTILKKVLKEAEAKGYTFFVDPECEFFLFHTDENGIPTTTTHEQAGYMDISPLDLGENARRDMVLTLEEMGFEIESSHHEIAPAQHEIDFKYAEAMKTADSIVTFRTAVRSIAKRFGLHATFMPKPKPGVAGSGMHMNISLFKDGKNLFSDPSDEAGISQEARWFMGGIMAHVKAMCAITNPLVNSYKRLMSGFEAPRDIIWTTRVQNTLIRIPSLKGEETSIELRFPDPSANPYLTLAVCLAAGMDGIERRLDPGAEAAYRFEERTPEEKAAAGVGQLPETLREAVAYMEQDAFMKNVLGGDFVQLYTDAKKAEWNEYMSQVSEWEVDKYLYRT